MTTERAGSGRGSNEQEKGPSDEDIGRPGPWGADRYQQPGGKVDQSVLTPPRTSPNPDPVKSTPVTREDYKNKGQEDEPSSEAPGGDAG
jgi:hypothetical protein